MKRKEKELYWMNQISDYRESRESLIQWCEKKEVKIHTMKYWLRKQASVSAESEKTAWIPCVVEEPSSTSITLKVKNVEIEVMSGFQGELLLRVLRTLEEL